jgi:SOS-response transcriptional repressor LexA
VVEADPTPPDGSVVAATVLGEGGHDEATVKVLGRRKGKVWLEPRNGNGEHGDIVVDGERVLVHGTVEWFVQRARG